MDNYLKKIINDNECLLKDYKITKINSGFTNLVYSVSDKYIIKICNNKNNETMFKNEIEFYLNNKNNKYIPKLYKYYLSTNEFDYSYIIIEKINGKSLYNLWHTFDEIKRKNIIKDISNLMKSFHIIKGNKYNWSLFIKNKLIKNFEICNKNNIFNNEEQEKIDYIINNIDKYLDNNEFSLVHSDIHFDNILINENNELKIIDFETVISAPIDYELDIFLRMCNNPKKYASVETEKYIKTFDYVNIPNYLKEYYPEIFNIHDFEIRHLIYDLEANIRLLARFNNDLELKEQVINIIDNIYTKMQNK